MSKDLVLINAFDHPAVPAIVGSIAGFLYPLPATLQLRPVVRIRALTDNEYRNQVPAQGAPQVPGTYRNWFLTTRDPTGKFLMRDAPLDQFRWDKSQRTARYLNDLHWIDPKQSFVYCTADNLPDLVALELTYF